jgi:hypothetical protein
MGALGEAGIGAASVPDVDAGVAVAATVETGGDVGVSDAGERSNHQSIAQPAATASRVRRT